MFGSSKSVVPVLVASLLLSLTFSLNAQASPPAIADVPSAYRQTAAMFDIPADIFYAVAMQESGRFVDAGSARTPWPWTLNVAGAGYYFETQGKAWDALNQAVVDGKTNIGVGLMQVTWPYNQHLLIDVYGALDPHANLRLGAQVLRACYDASGDWWIAVGCYHSPGDSVVRRERAARYRESVRRRLREFSGTAE